MNDDSPGPSNVVVFDENGDLIAGMAFPTFGSNSYTQSDAIAVVP